MIQKLKNFIEEIDYLLFIRFIAAILVIRQHVGFANPNLTVFDQPVHWLFFSYGSGSGNSAVVLFFVISGYLMGKITKAPSPKNIYNFYLARIKRILPLYYFVVGLSIFATWHFVIDTKNHPVDQYLSKLLFLKYDFSFPFNQVIWTIGVEMFFYLLCPLLVLVPFFTNKLPSIAKQVVTLIPFLISIWLVIFPQSIKTDIWSIRVFVESSGIFLSGFFLYNLLQNWSFLKSLAINKHLSFGLVYLVLMFDYKLIAFDKNIIITIATLLFILSQEFANNFKFETKPNVPNNLGNLTYGIYLIHMLWLIKINDSVGFLLETNFGKLKSGIIIWILVSILSILSAKFLQFCIEKPTNQYLSKLTWK